jgi:hypothetical protein
MPRYAQVARKMSQYQSDKEVCSTVKTARIKDGQTVVTAVLVEPEGEAKVFYIGLTSATQPFQPSQPPPLTARIIIDKEPRSAAPLPASPCAGQTMKRRPS